MLLAWRSAGLHRACESPTGLDRLWPPASALTARSLLSAVVHADRLGELLQYHSISHVLREQVGHIVVTMRLEEVEMDAAPLTRAGRLLAPAADALRSNAIGTVTGLLVEDLRARGVSLERAAG